MDDPNLRAYEVMTALRERGVPWEAILATAHGDGPYCRALRATVQTYRWHAEQQEKRLHRLSVILERDLKP